MNKSITAPKEEEIKIESIDLDPDALIKVVPTGTMDVETVEILVDDRISTGG